MNVQGLEIEVVDILGRQEIGIQETGTNFMEEIAREFIDTEVIVQATEIRL
jgi:hypothetical protein